MDEKERLDEVSKKMAEMSEKIRYLETTTQKTINDLTFFAEELVKTNETLLAQGEHILEDKESIQDIYKVLNDE